MSFATVPLVTQVRKFKPFEGKNIDRMQELRTGRDADGNQIDVPRRLISPGELAELRLHSPADDREYARNQTLLTYRHVAWKE